MSIRSIQQYVLQLKALFQRSARFNKVTALTLAGSALVAVGLLVSIGYESKTAQAFTCTSNPCPYDEKTGEFIGYPKPWPPNCVYIIPGLPSTESGKATASGNYKFNQNDRTVATTTKPQCYPEDVSKYGFTYFGRGHRMFNVGTYIDRSGFAYKYNADGSFIGAVCMVPEKCGTQNLTGSAGEAQAVAAATGATDPASGKAEVADPTGWLDSAACDGIKGWVFDSSNVGAAVTVHLYVDGKAGAGGKLLTSGTTTETRDDINKTFSLTGAHGFNIQLPDTIRDGKSHSVFAYGIDTDGGTNLLLGGGGKTFTCTGATGVSSTNPSAVPVTDKTTPIGWFDFANCNQFEGWAFDPDNSSAQIDVHFYKDGPAGKGTLLGYVPTTVLRNDINALYKISGNHGFIYRFNSVTGNPLADGKAHAIYAYAINSNGGTNPALGGSPRSVTCTAGAGTGTGTGTVGGGGGGSGRHNYLTPCNGSGYADKGDPGISVEVKDGKPVVSIDLTGVTDPVKVGGNVITGSTKIDSKIGDVIEITVGSDAYKFTVDTEGLKDGDTMSNLVPMPCIRIGYNDVLGGQQCEPGQGGTCADKLHVFCGPGAWQNNLLKDGEFEIWLKVVGNPTNIPWKKIDYIHDDTYSSPNAIQVEGKGVVYCKTAVKDSSGHTHYSLIATKTYDLVDKKDFE